MASSINASTGPGGGVATTADASGNLDLQSNGSTVVAMTATGVAVTGTLAVSGGVTLTTTLPVLQGGTGVTTSTGSGANVLSTSPTLVTPLLGTPTSGDLANCTGIPSPAALSTASGSAPSYSARAWVNFNGTLTTPITPRASGNVTNITKNGVGLYTVNITTALPDTNGSAVAMHKTAAGTAGAVRGTSPEILSTTTVSLTTYSGAGALESPAIVNLAIFR